MENHRHTLTVLKFPNAAGRHRASFCTTHPAMSLVECGTRIKSKLMDYKPCRFKIDRHKTTFVSIPPINHACCDVASHSTAKFARLSWSLYVYDEESTRKHSNITYTRPAIQTTFTSLIICWGQGTLKLPMSFSKFSLCPPLGAACHMLQRGKEMWSQVWNKEMEVMGWKLERLSVYSSTSWRCCHNMFSLCQVHLCMWIFGSPKIHSKSTQQQKMYHESICSFYPTQDHSKQRFPHQCLSTPYLPRFHLSRAKARRDGPGQGASGIREGSWVQQVVEGLGLMLAIYLKRVVWSLGRSKEVREVFETILQKLANHGKVRMWGNKQHPYLVETHTWQSSKVTAPGSWETWIHWRICRVDRPNTMQINKQASKQTNKQSLSSIHGSNVANL